MIHKNANCYPMLSWFLEQNNTELVKIAYEQNKEIE